ncbi:abortive infection family protein [Pseudomonas maumuensis]|uniref:Abortive infection family protein n=1 Tax=Pseudomonas maumuensis TaxID=2842354 RepID=A0ABX8NU49_9PSED|nr:abortive infection family protein [Pseudomonas maumuensis]
MSSPVVVKVTGHGKDGQHRRLQPRNAQLVLAAAVAFVDFVSETHRYREANNNMRIPGSK